MDVYSPVIVERLSFDLNEVLQKPNNLFGQLNHLLGIHIYKHVFYLYLRQQPLHVKINLIGYELSNLDLVIYYQLVLEYETITDTHEQLRNFMIEVCTLLENFHSPKKT